MQKLLPLIGIVAIVFGLGLQDMTFVASYIPLLFAGVCMAIVFGLSRLPSFSYLKTNVLALILGVGGCAYGLFLGLNFYLSSEEAKPLTYPILERGCANCGKADSSLHQPTAIVHAANQKRTFALRHASFEDLEKADSLVLIAYKGRLGFTVIKGWRLNK